MLPSLTGFARQATLRNASAPPLLLADPQELALPKNSDVGVGLLRQGCRTISFKEEVMADVYTCSCGNQTWQILETAVRCTACGTEFVAPHMPVAAFNHLVALELELELEEVLE